MHVEILRDTEKVVHICEPKIGKGLSDDEEKGTVKDLIKCQEGSDESSDCQVDNPKRSVDLMNFQEAKDDFLLPGGQ